MYDRAIRLFQQKRPYLAKQYISQQDCATDPPKARTTGSDKGEWPGAPKANTLRRPGREHPDRQAALRPGR